MQEFGNTDAILQLERVANAVSSALFAIARSADEDARKALVQITKEAAALGALINPPANDDRLQPATNPYTSLGLPDGYETVLGYMYEANPDLFEFVDPRSAWAKDEAWIESAAHKRGLPVIVVGACSYLQGLGVMNTKAYPRSLIRERLY